MDDYREFLTEEDINVWISANYSQKYMELMDKLYFKDFSFPLGDYKGMCSARFNFAARTGQGTEKENQSVLQIQNFIKQHTVAENIKVYRFVDIKELILLYQKTWGHKTYTYPQFLSTTLSKDLFGISAIRSSRFAISILVPAGTNGIYFPEVNPLRPEYEILMPHHTKLKRIGHMGFQIVNG